MIEGKYEIQLMCTGYFHFRAWLEDDGHRVRGYVKTGCSTRTHWRNRNREHCEKRAVQACRRLMREYERRRAAGGPVVMTVTLDGRPSYSDLQDRIAQLERELDIAT